MIDLFVLSKSFENIEINMRLKAVFQSENMIFKPTRLWDMNIEANFLLQYCDIKHKTRSLYCICLRGNYE